jgi:acetylornithine aminotransferase
MINEVRGKGLLVGIELNQEALPVVKECMQNGLLVLTAGSNVLRLLPPLNVTKKDIENALDILSKILG